MKRKDLLQLSEKNILTSLRKDGTYYPPARPSTVTYQTIESLEKRGMIRLVKKAHHMPFYIRTNARTGERMF